MAGSSEKSRNLSLYPLAWLSCALASGICAACFVRLSALFWIGAVAVVAIGTVFSLTKGKQSQATIFLLFAFAFAGGLLGEIEKQNAVAPNRLQTIYDRGEINSQTPLEIIGVLQTAPEEAVGGAFLTIGAEKINLRGVERSVAGAVRLFVPTGSPEQMRDYENLELRCGARVKVLTRVTREDRFRNPGYTPFREILAQNALDAAATLKSPMQIERLDDAPVFLPLAVLYEWRGFLIRRFRSLFSQQTAAVLIASLVGNRYFLSRDTAERFRSGGTFHILVISGFQITLIGAAAWWLIARLTKNLWAQFAAANTFLWFYSLMVGADVPVTRAALMFTILHAAVLFGRESTTINPLAAAALALLIWRPADLFDQSFQLTFVSVAALVLFAFPLAEKMRQIGAWHPAQAHPAPPACAPWLKTLCETLFWSESAWRREQRRHVWKCRLFKSSLAVQLEKMHLQTIWQFIFCSILISAIMQICLLPLTAIYFHRFSPAALILNLFVGALIAIESLAASAALLVSLVSPLVAQPLVWLCEALNWLMLRSVEPFAGYESASFRLPTYAGHLRAVYFLYFLPLIAFVIRLNCWNPFQLSANSHQLSKRVSTLVALITVHCLLITAIVFHPSSAPAADGRLRVDFLDAGQGDAALVTFPDGTTLLVDGGGTARPETRIEYEDGSGESFEPDARSIGEAVVCEFLWERGFDKIDFLLPTHADHDHIDGLNDVAQSFQIKSALVGRAPPNNGEFARFARTIAARGVSSIKIARGDRLEIGGATIEFLSPPFDADPNASSDNNNSVVFRLSYGARSVLFTGDIEAPTERDLLQTPESLKSDVVKIAHHGSRTSSIADFVRATNARFAVASVGRESRFGHPHKEVVERWQATGAQVLTTGANGTISFSTDGEDLQLETFVKK